MRYAGQIHEEEVLMASPRTGFEQLSAAFGELYETRYGFRREPELAELVNLRVVGLGRVQKPDLERAAARRLPAGGAPDPSRRPVFFGGAFLQTPVFERSALPVGFAVAGPAVVEEYDSTVVISPGWRATVDTVGSLVIERAQDA